MELNHTRQRKNPRLRIDARKKALQGGGEGEDRCEKGFFYSFNVYIRFGNSKEAIIGFIKSRPKEGVAGRRSMPQFNLTDEQLDGVAEFLKWTSEINSAKWPPNVQG